MKHILRLLAFALFPVLCHAQTSPDGFFGIKWGASVSDAQAILDANPDLQPLGQSDSALNYTGGTFGDVPVHKWHLNFQDDKFCGAVLTFEYLRGYVGQNSAGYMYSRLIGTISEKYGVPGKKAGTSTIWTYPDTPTSKGAKEIRLCFDFRAKSFWISYTNFYYEKSVDSDPGAKNL
jgi:hypothetical protein